MGSSEDKDQDKGTTETVDVSGTTAPSIGPNTKIEREDPEQRLARHEQSSEDALGLDKRRSVIGGRYSASVARQATLYGVFLAVAAAIVIDVLLLVNEVDQPPASNPDAAPWAKTEREPPALQ